MRFLGAQEIVKELSGPLALGETGVLLLLSNSVVPEVRGNCRVLTALHIEISFEQVTDVYSRLTKIISHIKSRADCLFPALLRDQRSSKCGMSIWW